MRDCFLEIFLLITIYRTYLYSYYYLARFAMENKISKMEFLKSNVSDTNYTKKGEEIVVITSDILEEDKRQILYHYHNNINPFEIT